MDPRRPILNEVAPGVTAIDTGMVGERELNAVYLIASEEPALIETGPGADGPVVLAALDELGIGPADLAHLIVTHIHIDHAGGAGALLERFPAASLWVHERGAPHLADPRRLVASTARTYGGARMRAMYGETLPCPSDRIRVITDGSRIPIGGRSLAVLHTPGHASHHVALHDERTGALFTGEAIGSFLPWAHCYRPALPPPEVDVEAGLASIERMRERSPSILLTSHFGPVDDPTEGFDRGAERIRTWSETARQELVADPGVAVERLSDILRAQAEREFGSDAPPGIPFDLERYDALGSIAMNAGGLLRYWRKRWEREAETTDPGIDAPQGS
jgi:glyoxylase-like metal-dependent hydrolase (beta-lactamase superfamily II)